ncbi:MAG: hypothetical protein JWR42_1563 [Marmoricola sp.]|nr:hypothetical protein [Marmoricola sp.]
MVTDDTIATIDVTAPPSGTGCADCDAAEPQGWWVHLRRCASCGHVGCCDTSPSQHATAHADSTGHQVIRSFEPGEDWFYDYETGRPFDGPELAAPESRPADQDSPGPGDRRTGPSTSTTETDQGAAPRPGPETRSARHPGGWVAGTGPGRGLRPPWVGGVRRRAWRSRVRLRTTVGGRPREGTLLLVR